MSPQLPEKVFISYRCESPEHKDNIYNLSKVLRVAGIPCMADIYFHRTPLQGWYKWMKEEINDADFVLCVCTKGYKESFDGKGTKGVNWEGSIISGKLFGNYGKNDKFIPILLDTNDEKHIPDELKPYYSGYVIKPNKLKYFVEQIIDENPVDSIDADALKHYIQDMLGERFEALYRHLTDQSKYPETSIGELVILDSTERKSSDKEQVQKSEGKFDKSLNNANLIRRKQNIIENTLAGPLPFLGEEKEEGKEK